MSNPLVSIIVPFKENDTLIRKFLIPRLKTQSYRNFELLLISDAECDGGPAKKRDYGVHISRGSIIAFIDSDAYPIHTHWLELAVLALGDDHIAAVCGPGLTPPDNSLMQKVSGAVWGSQFGAGGAGVYRNSIQPIRYVDDYPTFNFVIKKNDFLKAGGFNTHYWPGEDTMLCHELVYTLHKKILYTPSIPVYHVRRPLWMPHIEQVARYGIHRGYFTKILPKTSRRLGYYVPSLFVLYLACLPLLVRLDEKLYIFMGIYSLLLFMTSMSHFFKSRNTIESLLLAPAIFVTHFVYGLMFIRGIMVSDLKE